MCGIVSLLSRNAPVDGARLKAGTDALLHRGPDGEGHWLSARRNTGLGHRRLCIIDLETGAQPLVSADGRVAAVVNGEFYGYKTLRRELESKGHRFNTQSDSEILLPLYKEHGVDCLKFLRGEFAFVLWDEEKQQLFAARDRFGFKPLSYSMNADELMIASEAKALFAMGLSAAWDEYAFFHSAMMQYTPQDRTLFKNVQQLKPGHFLLARGGDVQISKYWDLDYRTEDQTRAFSSEAEATAAFKDLFEESVRLRLQADVPICIHLSGGLDSSAVLGVAAGLMDTPAHAFTVSFDHEVYDELPIAEEMARHTGATLHTVRVSQDDIVDFMPDAVYHGEGLAINGHITAKFLLNKAIRGAGFKVALTGEGSDEVLAGYPHLRQDLFRVHGNDNPAMAEKLYATNGVSLGVQLASGDMLPTEAVGAALGFVPAFLEAKASMGYRMHGVLSDDFTARFSKTDCYADLMREIPVATQLKGKHRVNQSAWLWNKLTLANYILRTLGDGMEMSHSIEGRLPFLDHVLFDFIRNLPVTLKIKGEIEKHILREAVKEKVTKTIYRRQKHPFMAPPVSRFSSARLMSFIQDKVRSQSFAAMPFFDRKKVIAALDGLPALSDAGKTAMEPVTMMLLTAQLLNENFRLS